MKTLILALVACVSVGASINLWNKKTVQTPLNTQKTLEKTTEKTADTGGGANLTVDELLGRFQPAKNPDFVKISPQHTSKSNAYLRKESYDAFKKMYDAAQKEGVSLKIISATRNFYDQKNIWDSKWRDSYAKYKEGKERALAILQYSSMPGSSRHHWGTDMDFNELNDNYFVKNGVGKKIYAWLQKHAHEYGFCQTYSEKGSRRTTGYEEEKWHWSYTPLAKNFMEQYREKVKYEDIKGFEGAQTAREIGIIENYVLGINPDCK